MSVRALFSLWRVTCELCFCLPGRKAVEVVCTVVVWSLLHRRTFAGRPDGKRLISSHFVSKHSFVQERVTGRIVEQMGGFVVPQLLRHIVDRPSCSTDCVAGGGERSWSDGGKFLSRSAGCRWMTELSGRVYERRRGGGVGSSVSSRGTCWRFLRAVAQG